MLRLPLALVAVIASAALLSACTASDNQAGFGLPTLDADEAAAAAGSAFGDVSGQLGVESNGCFVWRSADDVNDAWIVWPDDARHDADGVILASGARVTDGDPLTGVGALVSLADLPDGTNADSYFASFGGFCDAQERGVLVLTWVGAQ